MCINDIKRLNCISCQRAQSLSLKSVNGGYTSSINNKISHPLYLQPVSTVSISSSDTNNTTANPSISNNNKNEDISMNTTDTTVSISRNPGQIPATIRYKPKHDTSIHNSMNPQQQQEQYLLMSTFTMQPFSPTILSSNNTNNESNMNSSSPITLPTTTISSSPIQQSHSLHTTTNTINNLIDNPNAINNNPVENYTEV